MGGGGGGGEGQLEGADAESSVISMRPARNHQVAVFGSFNLIFSSSKTVTENRNSLKSYITFRSTQTEKETEVMAYW